MPTLATAAGLYTTETQAQNACWEIWEAALEESLTIGLAYLHRQSDELDGRDLTIHEHLAQL